MKHIFRVASNTCVFNREANLFGLLAALVMLLATDATARAEQPRRPNVVVILTDDQGWGDLSLNGNTNLATPHIDSLARDGAMFERFYVCPVCSPTRAEFLTGRYHVRGGVFRTSTGGERLDLDETTIAQAFKAAGYATGAFGKWHNGTQYPYHPNARGFDEFYGFCSGHWGDYFSPQLEHNGRLVQGDGYVTDDFTNRAMAFIEQHRDQPFFCYLPLNTPHSPMQVPEKFYQKFAKDPIKLRYHEPDQEDLAMTRAALAMCENIDWNVGRLLARLDELNLAENTIVVYFCDNGPNSYRYNGGMRGRKGSTDEGGVRSPLLVRWPGKIAPGTRIEPIAAAIDLLPTLTALAGIEAAAQKSLDGVDVSPLLLGKRTTAADRMIFSHWSGRVSVRTQQYRLDHAGRLYDMQRDPGQQRDIAVEKPEVAKRLRQAVKVWRRDVLSELDKTNRPYSVGYREFPQALLPARDGVPHGNVQRSGRAPNCSFFTGWTSPEDRITWDIEVATPGRYEVTVHYTCPADDVGSTIELSFGDSRLEARVSQAHDPPLEGASDDRVDRGSESYVKDFKPWTLGHINLPRGRGQLTLRALNVPGRSVMEVRYLVLKLLPQAAD